MSDKNNPDKQVDAVIRSLESPEDRKNREDHEKKFREIFISKKSEYKPPDFLAGGTQGAAVSAINLAKSSINSTQFDGLTQAENHTLYPWSDGATEYVRVETWIGPDTPAGAKHLVCILAPGSRAIVLSKLEAIELCKMLMGAAK
jgi:hypothetical protein